MKLIIVLTSLLVLVNCNGPVIRKPVKKPAVDLNKIAIATCPAEKRLGRLCPAITLNSCPTRSCTIIKNQGYFCGFKFFFHKSYVFTGTKCLKEGSGCFPDTQSCSCYTTFGWKTRPVIVKHYNLYYAVWAWVKIPNGCRCYKTLSFTPPGDFAIRTSQ